jgi:PhoH-like ATPase
MLKTFVLDTNVLLHNPQSLFAFKDNRLVLPLAVIEEIDDQKKRHDEIGRNAREVSRLLDELRSAGDLSRGVPLPGGGTIRIEVNQRHVEAIGRELDVIDLAKPDNRILAVALNLSRESQDGPVFLVSKDLNLRVKADVLGVRAQDLDFDKVDFKVLYSGQTEARVTRDRIDALYRDRRLDLDGLSEVRPNQFVILKNVTDGSSSALARRIGDDLVPVTAGVADECFGLRARNKEQTFALDLLLDETVQIVTLAGGAGTGKTLLALAAGLEMVLERGAYAKLLVTRPIVPLSGQDLGYLPGDKDEKIRPWMQPIYDNLEFLLNRNQNRDGVWAGGKAAPVGPKRQPAVDPETYLTFSGQIELEALSYIRGRSIARQFILVDEAQNCTAHTIKTLLTRVGEGSKIVFTGDIEQIDHPYLDSASNGFTRLVEKLKDAPLAGHMTLFRGERSRVAELGATLL